MKHWGEGCKVYEKQTKKTETMKKTEPYYNVIGQLEIPPAYTGRRLETWLNKHRKKPVKQSITVPQQVMAARLNSGGIDEKWCYNFIEKNLEKGDIIRNLQSVDTLKASQLLMRIFYIMAGKDSGRVFEKAIAMGDFKKASSMASPSNAKLLPIYIKAVRKMRVKLVK